MLLNEIISGTVGAGVGGVVALGVELVRSQVSLRARARNENASAGQEKEVREAIDFLLRTGALERLNLKNDSPLVLKQLENHLPSQLEVYNGFPCYGRNVSVTAYVPRRVRGATWDEKSQLITLILTPNAQDGRAVSYYQISPGNLLAVMAQELREVDAFAQAKLAPRHRRPDGPDRFVPYQPRRVDHSF